MANAVRLSAILFCDIEGYTALMQQDEIGTLRLLDKYEQTLTKMVEKYGGKIIKNYGDGSICLFNSAVGMVQCAIEVQHSLREPPMVPLRIGLNLGDVHRVGDDVFGDAVNITSRIEDMGIGGNILLSQSLHQKVKNHPEFEFSSLGKFDFKNIDKAIEVFAVSNDGITVPKRKQLHGKFKKSEGKLKKLWFVILLALVAIFYLVQNSIRTNNRLSDKGDQDKIAVLKFENYTGDAKYDITGEMAVDWIIHGITQNKVGQVISPENIADYTKVLEASLVPSVNNSAVTDYLKPSKIIKGSFYLNKGRLLFQCSITDELMDKTLISLVPVECDPSAPLDCIEALKQRILGYLITEDKKSTNIQETPPNYEAYQYLLEAKLHQYKNNDEHLRLLDKAIAADTNYFEPKTYKLTFYYNMGDYVVADSLLRSYKSITKTNERERNLLSLYEALLLGNNRDIYTYQQKEYNATPIDMETNSSMMTVALQFVNNPKAVDSIYDEIEMKDMDLQFCSYCEDRYYIKALADIALGNYKSAIKVLQEFEKKPAFDKLKKILIRAYTKSENYDMAEKLISDIQLTADEMDWMAIALYNARDLLVQDQIAMGNVHLDKIIYALVNASKSQDLEYQKMLAECLILKEDYVKAMPVLERIIQADKNQISQSAWLALCYQKNGRPPEAKMQLEQLESLRGTYQYGSVDYALAQYYAATGDEDNAIKALTRSVAAGRWYDTTSYQNDPFFKNYDRSPAFDRIMKYWE